MDDYYYGGVDDGYYDDGYYPMPHDPVYPSGKMGAYGSKSDMMGE